MTFSQILDNVDELPIPQQESLIDIIKKRIIEHRRSEIALDAKIAINDYEKGNLKPETSNELIERLHKSLDTNE
jgi:hypothetical protein